MMIEIWFGGLGRVCGNDSAGDGVFALWGEQDVIIAHLLIGLYAVVRQREMQYLLTDIKTTVENL